MSPGTQAVPTVVGTSYPAMSCKSLARDQYSDSCRNTDPGRSPTKRVHRSLASGINYVQSMSTDGKPSLSELSRVLARVSQREHNYAFKTFQHIASDAGRLEDNLIEIEYQISQQKLATQESLEVVRSIRVELPKKILAETERLRTFLERRKKSDDTFSVCLFGRTNAGKSTLREAITGGDGSTIGQGEQRTTQEVTTYDWEGIKGYLIKIIGCCILRGMFRCPFN